jgi:hypothetical protein
MNKSLKKIKLIWYYHENSDSFFIDKENQNFGNEVCIEIGEYKDGTIEELRQLLENSKHYKEYRSKFSSELEWQNFYQNK